MLLGHVDDFTFLKYQKILNQKYMPKKGDTWAVIHPFKLTVKKMQNSILPVVRSRQQGQHSAAAELPLSTVFLQTAGGAGSTAHRDSYVPCGPPQNIPTPPHNANKHTSLVVLMRLRILSGEAAHVLLLKTQDLGGVGSVGGNVIQNAHCSTVNFFFFNKCNQRGFGLTSAGCGRGTL